MKHSSRELALALAGVFQAASLVKQIATTGMANSAVIEASLETLFKFDADSVEDVYGLSLIHISEPTRPELVSRMPSSA